MTRYEFLVNEGILRPDDHQRQIVKKLMPLWEQLKDYDPGPMPEEDDGVSPSFVSPLLSEELLSPATSTLGRSRSPKLATSC